MTPLTPNLGTAANRRPAGQSDASERLVRPGGAGGRLCQTSVRTSPRVRRLSPLLGNSARATLRDSRAQPAFMQPQRGCDPKPKVAAARLPWVNRQEGERPQRGRGSKVSAGHNPFRVVRAIGHCPKAASQPWAGSRNPFGIHLMAERRALLGTDGSDAAHRPGNARRSKPSPPLPLCRFVSPPFPPA